MERRKFLASSLAASAMAAVASSEYLQAAPSTGREFYQLRLYRFINGPQRKAADAYFKDALIPALNRLGITPVGVLNLTIGPQTPTVYLLMPGTSLETLITVEDDDLASRHPDDPPLLKIVQGDRDASTPHPKHQRQELVGERNLVTIQTVIGHEQPAGQALLEGGGTI